MEKFTFRRKALSTLCALVIGACSAFSQTWQGHSQIVQNYPNNDVKSYGGKLWVASNKGLFNSSDNGVTWTDVTSSFPGNSDLVEIQFTNSGNIFVRQNSYGVIRSLDGGTTWELDTVGVGSNYSTHVLYYDGTADRVFLGIGYPKYKLYYQAPGDAGWTAVTAIPSTMNSFTPVQMTRKGSKLFLVDIYRRVLESSDNGITWTQKTGTGLVDAQSQVGPARFLSIGNDLYYGISGVWKSTNDGDSWTRIDQGFASADTRCLYYDGTTLYASVYSGRKTYKSTDNGTTWTEFGGTGSWFFKAMAMHNNSLYGVIHSKDSLYVLGSGSTGLLALAQDPEFDIFPNPANESVSISDIPVNATIKVLDITGKEVYRMLSEREQETINTTSFTNGIYFIQIEAINRTSTRKLVISK